MAVLENLKQGKPCGIAERLEAEVIKDEDRTLHDAVYLFKIGSIVFRLLHFTEEAGRRVILYRVSMMAGLEAESRTNEAFSYSGRSCYYNILAPGDPGAVG